MHQKAVTVVLASVGSLGLASCATNIEPLPIPAPTGVADLMFEASEALADRAGPDIARDRPIVVTTMVSVDDLQNSSTLGRLASEFALSGLTRRGYIVRDMTYTHVLTISQETGELILSRDASKLLANTHAQAVVVGTYAIGGREIYINMRLLRADNGQVLSSADVVLPLNSNTAALIQHPPGVLPPIAVAPARTSPAVVRLSPSGKLE